MTDRTAIAPQQRELLAMVQEAEHRASWPSLYCPEEMLGQLLSCVRLAFAIAGPGEEGSLRRQLHDQLAGYVDAPPATSARAA